MVSWKYNSKVLLAVCSQELNIDKTALLHTVGNKVKGRISKQVFQENNTH